LRQRFPHHIGADQGAVHIHDQRYFFGISHGRMLEDWASRLQ
jgi:hypothetical protein